jgi:hypothetical protein
MTIVVQEWRNKLGFLLLALAGLGPALGQGSNTAADTSQIQALLKEKLSRNPAQRKLDSQILFNARLAAGQPIAPGLPDSFKPAPLEKSADGLIHVDIDAEVTPGLQSAIKELGGRVELALAQYKSVRAWIPLAAAEKLAERADVHFVKPAEQSRTNAVMPPGARPPKP